MNQMTLTMFHIRNTPVVLLLAIVVPRQTYRAWMKSTEPHNLTAIEELTLEDEYAMKSGPSLLASTRLCRPKSHI